MVRRTYFVAWAFFSLIDFASTAEQRPVNRLITQTNIDQTICVHGYTKTVRPSTAFINIVKRQMMISAGVPPEGLVDITLDHIVPLALGGSPDDPRNLMLQPDDESKDKDRVEVCLARRVCRGQISLLEAQQAIWSNWRTAGRLCADYKVPLAE